MLILLAKSVESKSWVELLVLCTGKVGHSFVGETDSAKLFGASAYVLCTSGLVN